MENIGTATKLMSDKVEYLGQVWEVEAIYVYDEYMRIYQGNLLKTESIKVRIADVKFLSIIEDNKITTQKNGYNRDTNTSL